MLLAGQFLLVELGLRQDIREDIHGQRHMVLQHAGIIGCRLGRGGGVQLAADILDLLSDLPGGSLARALERHVFQQMRDPVFGFGLVPRSRLDPGAESHALKMRHGLGYDRKPGWQPGALNIHDPSFCVSFWVARA